MGRITPKREQFIYDWIETNNKTEAYRRNYKCDNISEDKINRKASELSKLPDMEGRYNEIMKQRCEKSCVTADRVINELAKIGFHNIEDYLEVTTREGTEGLIQGVRIKDSRELKEEQKGVISSIKETREGIELKFYDKVNALTKLGDYLGIFKKDKIEVNVNNFDTLKDKFEEE